MQNKLFTNCQSGFIPGDSCVPQLLLIMHETAIHQLIWGVAFLDIFEVFDKVLREDLIFKLKNYGVDGNLLKRLEKNLTGL